MSEPKQKIELMPGITFQKKNNKVLLVITEINRHKKMAIIMNMIRQCTLEDMSFDQIYENIEKGVFILVAPNDAVEKIKEFINSSKEYEARHRKKLIEQEGITRNFLNNKKLVEGYIHAELHKKR